MTQRKLISFNWAIKKLLRSKANFDILEGFLSELLFEDIKIIEILESENDENEDYDDYNRVEYLIKSNDNCNIIVELQYDYEYEFMHRKLYRTSKIITEHMKQGAPYSEVKKIIIINIVYFDLGQGKDYVYKGTTNFIGIHEKDELQLSQIQKGKLKKESIFQLYSEYYLLKINNFNDFAKNTLDEWIYFLKNEEIKPEFKAKGLKEAKDKLDIMKISGSDLQSYNRHRENLHYLASMAKSVKIEAEEKNWKQGLAEGEKQAKFDITKKMLINGIDIEIISDSTGLSIEEIKLIVKGEG
ncbi:MAG: Rpn family recombination-promoting nuclease/putative transposase [Candidatus Delongbacteria bacterium]|nr:Rpn family recombination-promoting nuclease/putative transposase [Candidatus Delongbacteria bacterium]